MFSKLKQVFVYLSIVMLLLSYPVSALAGGPFGVGVYLSSEPDGDKTAIANSMSDLGISITRMTVNYGTNIDWAPYDTAVDLTRARGIENLILLHYEGDRPSVDAWGDFVASVASRYSGKTVAYEIFNEADNYISGSDYASYLWRSHDKIKQYDSGTKIIVSGLTARSAATSFWDGIYSAGGWDKFDALGLHPYRDSAPEKVEFNIGDFVTSINIAANWIRAKGGSKKIWLTEFGVRSTTTGDSKQANYIARSYIMSRAIPEVEKVMMYRYRDGDGWGMVRNDLSHKDMYDRYKNVIDPLDYSGTAERIYVYDKSVIDSYDSVSGWETNESSNGWLSLSETSGYSGGGMKYAYNFSSSSGYVVAKREKSLEGSPVGLGLWAKGPSTSSVLKLRIKDNNGETFQFDLGKVTNDWAFYKFDFSLDSAKTSWGGNGTIDYPIKFDSIVYDCQGGTWNGTLYLDEVVGINDSADLFAYKLGSKLAYWKVSGSKTTSTCGKTLTFKEEPQITDVSSCSTWDTGASSSSSSSTSSQETSTTTTTESAPPPETQTISQEKSTISVDKDYATADGKDTVSITVTLKSNKDEVMTSSKLAAEVSGSANTISGATKDGDNYKITLKSTKAEEKNIKVKIGSWELGSKKVTFEPGDYTNANTVIVPSKWTASIGDEIDLDLKVRDANDNEVKPDKKPTSQWQVALSEGQAELTSPSAQNNWKGKIKLTQAGKIALSGTYNGKTLETKTILYCNPTLSKVEDISTDKVYSIKKDQTLTLTGKPKDTVAFRLEEMTDASKVVVKISSTPTYFWLAKNTATSQYEGTLTLPVEEGTHDLVIYSESEKGQTTEFAKGTVEVSSEAETTMVATTIPDKTTTTPTWKYLLMGLEVLVLLGLILILTVPKLRMGFFGWLKKVFKKSEKDPEDPKQIEEGDSPPEN